MKHLTSIKLIAVLAVIGALAIAVAAAASRTASGTTNIAANRFAQPR